MRSYTVLQDYSVPRLNGKDGVVWTEGSTVVLHDDDAGWVNRDRAGTLAPVDDEAEEAEPTEVPDAAPDADEQAEETKVPATTPAAEQTGGRPKGRTRRRDSAG